LLFVCKVVNLNRASNGGEWIGIDETS
jgi:hypothetical protein